MTPVQEEKIYQLWKDLDAFKKQLAMTEGKPEYAPRRLSSLGSCAAHSRTARQVSHPPHAWAPPRRGRMWSCVVANAPHQRGIVLSCQWAHARALHDQQRLATTASTPP